MKKLNCKELETVQGGIIRVRIPELETTDIKLAGMEVPTRVKSIRGLKINTSLITKGINLAKVIHTFDFPRDKD